MKNLLVIVCFCFVFSAYANDSTLYICKYRYTYQADSTRVNSKKDDIMMLIIKPGSSVFFSYLRQLGERNREKELAKLKNDNNRSGMVTLNPLDEKLFSTFFLKNEPEILYIDYVASKTKTTDWFSITQPAYTAIDTLVSPQWIIGSATDSIAGQPCQSATSNFRGRNYTAWFAPHIPFNMGPWLFNGLPGLILKVEDDKNQFLFEATELNLPDSIGTVYKPYAQIEQVSIKKLREMKKLKVQNYQKFQEQVEGRNISIMDANGRPVRYPDLPYNPIDLTKE